MVEQRRTGEDPVVELTAGDDPWHTSYELTPELSRPDGALYGGTGLAASFDAFELATGRPSLFAMVQFVSQAATGAHIEQVLEPVARGRNIDQLRLTATSGGQLLYCALGACGSPRAAEIEGTGPTMPRVPDPEGRRPWFEVQAEIRAEVGTDVPPPPKMPMGGGGPGFHQVIDFREVPNDLGAERVTMWARMRGRTTNTPASLAMLADIVPIAIARAGGVMGAGFSLDNTLRVANLAESEWVLVDIEGHAAHGGYGYGHAHLWTPDGVLLATASQTSKMFSFADRGWDTPA